MGNITFELYTEHAPKACENFRVLAQSKYYDGTSFHRIIPNFMVRSDSCEGVSHPSDSLAEQRRFRVEIRVGQVEEERRFGRDLCQSSNSSGFFLGGISHQTP